MNINYIFRKKSMGYSIETVFINIISGLPDHFVAKLIYVPHNRSNIITIIRNALFLFFRKSKLIHITGDVHYAAIFARGKKILTIHDVYSILKGSVFKRFLLELLYFKIPALFVERITVVSEFTKLELLEIIPFAKDKVRVIYNPINRSIYYVKKDFNEDKPVILHIGTSENKNLLRLSEALLNIKCKLIVVGSLTLTQLKSLEFNQIDYDNVVDISYEEMAELYRNCDVVSFPSLYEGFGMPILEGNMAGRVVLTSNICSMPEIASNAAFFVDPFDVKSIRDGFLKIFSDKNLRLDLINNGFNNIDRFTVETVSAKYADLYEELI
jgi:glycosyltransferase involved in cell wall biosynthesis